MESEKFRLTYLYKRLGRHLGLLAVQVLLLTCAACEERLRLPYIEPALHNWPENYHGVAGLKLHVFNTGSIQVPSRVVYESGSLAQRQALDILVFGIEHPKHGLILIGTGLNRAIVQDAEHYLGGFRSAIGAAHMEPEQDILSQLKTAQLSSDKVSFVVLPDLRLDHAGELESFSHATVVVTSAEHTAAISSGNFGLYLQDEFDQVGEWQFVDFTASKPLGTFSTAQDVFGDGSVELIDVTGATAGGLAVLVRLPTQPVILCGNLAWTESQYRYAWTPGFAFKREAWWDAVWRLKKFKDLFPALVVLPDHDWVAVEKAKTADIIDMIVHTFSAPESSEDDTERDAALRHNPPRSRFSRNFSG